MVGADHSSTCGMVDGNIIEGGTAVGYVIQFNSGEKIYHSGDTGIFGDMALIDELYQPNILLLPIEGQQTMGPEEAAFACSRFFKSAKWVIPMSFGTQDDIKLNQFEQFV